MKKNTFFEKTAAPEPIHLMTEVTSILGSICKNERTDKAFDDAVIRLVEFEKEHKLV